MGLIVERFHGGNFYEFSTIVLSFYNIEKHGVGIIGAFNVYYVMASGDVEFMKSYEHKVGLNFMYICGQLEGLKCNELWKFIRRPVVLCWPLFHC